MNETRNAATTSPQAFRMDTLLQEMQAIERVPPMLGPAVADLASEAGTWYKEYLDSETSIQGRTNENNLINELGLSAQPKHWFLEAEAQWNQASSEVSNQSEAAKWVQEYNPQEDSELAKTANEILGTVDDPKFSNTEFMKYIRTLGKGGQSESAQGWQDEFLSSPQMLESNFWSREFTDENPIAVDSWGAEFLKEIANSREAPFKPQEWQKEFDEAQRKGTFDDVVVDSEAMSEKERE
ncbi:UNVERIFIED_CONTAM: hypothetical protein GTU68_031262, partial [Idotea baltica]|nr:hypothetical protein [Idotea baltica]